VAALLVAGATSAQAADMPAPPPVLATDWTSTITHTIQLEGGITVNPDKGSQGRNFGQLFTDIPNQPVFNQLLVTLARPIDATKPWDVGFNLQGLIGTDGRYDPTLGILDYTLKDRVQAVMTQANIVVHSPFLTAGGIDTKVGLYPGLMGYETTDPSTRPFYTLSYVSNFLLAFEHVGVTSTWHVNPTLDIITGVDAGNEVSPWRDNNSEPAGYAGFQLNNLVNNKLTVLAVSRFGPEDSVKALGPAANDYFRFWNDVLFTYKATDKLTLVLEGDYFKDDGLKLATGQRAEAYGGDAYASYAFNDQVTFNLRGEIVRDTTGLIVTSFLTNTGFTNAIAGFPDIYQNAPPTTYGAITAGVSLKPAILNTKDVKVTIRPEVRYDASLNGTQPFDNLSKSNQFLFATDVILAF
jgi:hypothetical protein